MKVLIFGANGQVGQALQRVLPDEDVEILALGRHDRGGDVVQVEEVEAVIENFAPHVIVNAAAFTQVDLAETLVNETFAVNELAVGNLARCAKASGALLIHFGTDFVFDGSGDHRWSEADATNPLNVYGRSKLAGEVAIIQSGCRYVILRVSWVYAPNHKNFITSAIHWLQTQPVVRIVDDQWGSPTSATDIALAVKSVIKRAIDDPTIDGIYHFANDEVTTRFECVRFIASLMPNLSQVELEAAASSSFDLPASRPLNCRLDTNKFKRTFQFSPRHWQEGVREIVLSK